MNSRRITTEERDELRDAIRAGKITNATAFAEAYGSEHGLNPSTVRTTISRLRHEAGALERGGVSVRGADRAGWFVRVLAVADPADVAEVGAAVLVRYNADAEFKNAVDQRKAKVAKLYGTLQELRADTEDLPERVRAELLYAFLDTGAD